MNNDHAKFRIQAVKEFDIKNSAMLLLLTFPCYSSEVMKNSLKFLSFY